MSMRGACRCGNMAFLWRNLDFSLVPRACTCGYCRAQDAAWLSKSGTALHVTVRNSGLHQVKKQGSGQARFHECTHCGQVVWVGARIGEDSYGALNLACLRDRARFPAPRPVELTELGTQEKLLRWQQNWCCPVTVEAGGEALQ